LPKKELEAQIDPLKQQLSTRWRRMNPQLANAIESLDRQLRRNLGDEILPIAREAHARLEFRNVKPFWMTTESLRAARQSKNSARSNAISHVGKRRRARRAAQSRGGRPLPIYWKKSCSEEKCEPLSSV
jgi:hypothetical protein